MEKVNDLRKAVSITIRVEEDALSFIEAIAFNHGRDRSKEINRLIYEEIRRYSVDERRATELLDRCALNIGLIRNDGPTGSVKQLQQYIELNHLLTEINEAKLRLGYKHGLYDDLTYYHEVFKQFLDRGNFTGEMLG